MGSLDFGASKLPLSFPSDEMSIRAGLMLVLLELRPFPDVTEPVKSFQSSSPMDKVFDLIGCWGVWFWNDMFEG